MCLLIVSPAGTNIPEAHLDNAQMMNDDGYGYAIVTNGEIIVNKGMDYEAIKAAWFRDRALYPDHDAMFHLRISTAGTVDHFNCHPFYVGNDMRTILAHNGVLPVDPEKWDPRSDTHMFAQDMLPQMLTGLDDEAWVADFEKWVGYNKLVVMSLNPLLQRYTYIINEQMGSWHEGVWYSNDYWRPYQPRRYSSWTRSANPYVWDDDNLDDWSSYGSTTTTTVSSQRFSEQIDGLDEMSWPSWSSVPLPGNGYCYSSTEFEIIRGLGLYVTDCTFCEAEIAFEDTIPDVCWVCHMDPLSNPRSIRESAGTVIERAQPSRLPTSEFGPGAIYYNSEGAFVYDGTAWQQYTEADGEWEDFVERTRNSVAETFISTIAHAHEPTDDVIFAQSETDHTFLAHEEGRLIEMSK